jgi:hypothetical protein
MQPGPFTRPQLRRTAAVMLAAWVFALCSGVAHACLLPAAAEMGSPAMALPAGALVLDLAMPAQELAEHVHHATGQHDDDPAEGSGREACLKFCADESSALTKDDGSPADLPASQPLAFVQWQRPALSSMPCAWLPADDPPRAGPPLFLRLLRLTI